MQSFFLSLVARLSLFFLKRGGERRILMSMGYEESRPSRVRKDIWLYLSLNSSNLGTRILPSQRHIRLLYALSLYHVQAKASSRERQHLVERDRWK